MGEGFSTSFELFVGKLLVDQIFEFVECIGAMLRSFFLAGFACQWVSIRILLFGYMELDNHPSMFSKKI